MIVTQVLGNTSELTTAELDALHVERVVLPLEALTRRRQRVTSDHGTDIGIQLPAGAHLHDGDILARDGHGVVVVSIETSDVLVIAPTSIEQMGVTAHALGNRHLPAQFFGPGTAFDGLDDHDGVMVIAYDHTAEQYLVAHGGAARPCATGPGAPLPPCRAHPLSRGHCRPGSCPWRRCATRRPRPVPSRTPSGWRPTCPRAR